MREVFFRVLLSLSLLGLFCVGPGFAGSDDDMKALRDEVEALKQGQAGLQRELEGIKAFLRRLAGSAGELRNVVLTVEGHPSRGDQAAKLTLVEFSDYQCPYCGRFFRETRPQIEKEYVETGKVRYVFRDFPIESIHKEAFKAAEAASCAGDQGRYWEMHDRLFANQDTLAPEHFAGHARAVGLDVASFQECLKNEKYAAAIRQDVSEGEKAGVRGTPSFFFGMTEPGGSSIKAVKAIPGAASYATFKEVIESLLSAQQN